MYNNTIIKKMVCGRVYPKWILIVQEFDDLSCVMSVELLSLCWSLVLKSTDVNLGSASLISAHTQGTFRMDHSIIHSILISTAALIHRTGTRISTLSTALSPWSIQIVSWSASWLSVVSTCKESQRSNASNDQRPELDTALRLLTGWWNPPSLIIMPCRFGSGLFLMVAMAICNKSLSKVKMDMVL